MIIEKTIQRVWYTYVCVFEIETEKVNNSFVLDITLSKYVSNKANQYNYILQSIYNLGTLTGKCIDESRLAAKQYFISVPQKHWTKCIT